MNYDHRDKPLVLVIFGITGDLAQRKLLPALYHLAQANELPANLHIIGISRRDVAKDEVYKQLHDRVGEEDYDTDIEKRLYDATAMRQMDLLGKDDYERLFADLKQLEDDLGDGVSRLYYLSVPSHAFEPIVKLLGETGHNAPLEAGDAPRLLIEKPFGYDLTSAKELIDVLNQHFGEGQVYRIDHYVAKETVQNILVFRFQNPLFEHVWDAQHVSSISIVAHEKIGIEGRADFYEQTGALRDLVQSHLLQLLAITTMERPPKLESDDIHNKKLALLEAITPIAADEVASKTIRGQYEGYRAEVNNPDSMVETFARLQLQIDTDQWRDVAITLETGKAMADKLTEITVCFGELENSNKLIFRIQPDEGITLRLHTKQPGIQNNTELADMDFDYARAFKERSAEAYERVIVDAIRGDQTLFASSAEVIRSWEIIENVLEQWSRNADGLLSYTPGSAPS